ncbi:hypothetical protein ACFWP3_37750 [Streptomyces sp. NPDC058525]|uniref:hypothetical protein n=1 Tax=Streptomyces sp. NPDC058525 TaxID=3346538 RepID=UPI00364D8431
MTTHVQRPATVSARIDDDSTRVPAAVYPAPAMSVEEYQRRTLEELADDVIVGGVAYSRAEWEAAEEGVRRTTTDEDDPRRVRAAEVAPAARRAPSVWNGTDAPF